MLILIIVSALMATTNGRLRKEHKCVHDQLIGISTLNATRSHVHYATSAVTRTTITSSSRRRLGYENMRFHVEFTDDLISAASSPSTPISTKKRIVEDYVPAATSYWESALQVRNQVPKLNFQRNCTLFMKWQNGDKQCHIGRWGRV